MIPSHDLDIIENQKIIIEKLDVLQSYDFGIPHRHEYFEMFFFDKGDGSHMIDFTEFGVQNTSIHFVAPGQIHQLKREVDSSGFVVLFHQDVFEDIPMISDYLFDFICIEPDQFSPVFKFPKTNDVEFYLNRIWNAKGNDSPISEIQTKNFLSQILLECIQLNSNKINVNDSQYASFRKAVRFNFKKWHKVQDYANFLGLTDKSLNEMAKKYTGKKASELIYNHIILEAKRLLQTNASIKETAFQLSFDDPSHFSKFFKSKVGVSPSEFQKVPD